MYEFIIKIQVWLWIAGVSCVSVSIVSFVLSRKADRINALSETKMLLNSARTYFISLSILFFVCCVLLDFISSSIITTDDEFIDCVNDCAECCDGQYSAKYCLDGGVE